MCANSTALQGASTFTFRLLELQFTGFVNRAYDTVETCAEKKGKGLFIKAYCRGSEILSFTIKINE